MARAISSLPVPVSPVIRTVASVVATCSTISSDVFEFGGVGEDFLEPWRLAELFAQRNIFGFELLAELADFFVGESVGGGDGKSARDVFEDGFLVRWKWRAA